MKNGKNQTILLVEDEDQQRELLSTIFEAQGYSVLNAESAEVALQHIENIVPGMIVTDVKMPGMDGFTFFDLVRNSSRCPTTPFIFITGYNDPQAIERVKQLGAVAYITKPYELGDLMSLVNQVLPPEVGAM